MSSVYPVPGPAMIIDAVDRRDRPVGKMYRREALSAGQSFRVAHLFIFNSLDELLVQQLAPTRDRHPLRWGSSVAAYLFAGESYADAMARRSVQELGGRIDQFEPVGKTVMRDAASEKFIMLFRAQNDGPFDVDTSHIASVEFLPMPEIESLMSSGRREFTPTFRHLFDFFRSARLG